MSARGLAGAALLLAFGVFVVGPAVADVTSDGATTITVDKVCDNGIVTTNGDRFEVKEGVSLAEGKTYTVSYQGIDFMWFDRTITSADQRNNWAASKMVFLMPTNRGSSGC